MNLTAIAAAVAKATGANASNLQVVITSHEVNASVFLFYLPSTQMLTYGVQTALRRAIFLNLSTTPGLAYNNQNASQAAYALHYTLGNVTSVTAEAASEAVYSQEPAVARRRRLQQFSTTDSSSTSSSAYSTGAGGALAANAAPPVVQYALQVPVSLSGFGNSSTSAAAASAQLDVLMSSPWLYGILSAALGSTPLDSIGGNTPTTSAVMQVQVTASTPEEAAHWSSVLASTTADNTLTTAVSQSIGANVTLLPRGNDVKLPVDRLANFDSRIKNALEGGVLAGIIIGFLILGLLACVAFAIVFIMRRQRARKLSKPTVKISTPMGADEHEHDYFAEPRRDKPRVDHKAAGGSAPRSPCWWPCAGKGAGPSTQSPRHAEADDRHAYEANDAGEAFAAPPRRAAPAAHADEERGERAAAPSHPCCWQRPRADEEPHHAEERHRTEKPRRVKEPKPKPELKSDSLFDDDDNDDEAFDLEEAPEPARPRKAWLAPPPQAMKRELRSQAEPEEVVVWETSSAPAPASKPQTEKARRAPPAEEPAPEMTVWEASAPQKARAPAPAPATAAKAPPPPPAAAKAPAPSAAALPPPPKAVRTREAASPAPQPTAVVAAQPPSAVSSPVASPLASPEASFEHSWEPVGLHPRVWPPAVGRGSGYGPDDLRADSGASLHELVSADLERVARERAALKSAEELRMQRRRERKAEAMRRLAAAAGPAAQ